MKLLIIQVHWFQHLCNKTYVNQRNIKLLLTAIIASVNFITSNACVTILNSHPVIRTTNTTQSNSICPIPFLVCDEARRHAIDCHQVTDVFVDSNSPKCWRQWWLYRHPVYLIKAIQIRLAPMPLWEAEKWQDRLIRRTWWGGQCAWVSRCTGGSERPKAAAIDSYWSSPLDESSCTERRSKCSLTWLLSCRSFLLSLSVHPIHVHIFNHVQKLTIWLQTRIHLFQVKPLILTNRHKNTCLKNQ